MPCTTGAPIWVRRANCGSRCSGLKSPDARAKARWSSSVKTRAAMARSEVIDGPISTADHGRDDLPGIKVTGKAEQALKPRDLIAAFPDLPRRWQIAIEGAQIAGEKPEPSLGGRHGGIENGLPFHGDFGRQCDELKNLAKPKRLDGERFVG